MPFSMILSSSSWSFAGSYRPAWVTWAQTSLGGERCQAPLHRFVPVLVSTHLRHDAMSSINGETVPKPKCTENS